MRTHEGDAALQFVVGHLGERRAQARLDRIAFRDAPVGVAGHVEPRGRPVGEGDRLGTVREVAVEAIDRVGERVDRGDPRREHRGRVRDELLGPDVEGAPGGGLGRRAQGAVLLQQVVALLQHPVVLAARGRERGAALAQEVVEVAPALPRVAADDRDVLGREEHHPQHAQRVRGPAHVLAVHPGPGTPAGADLELERAPATLVGLEHQADDPDLGAGPDQRLVARDPVTRTRGRTVDGLDEVGLALRVGPDEHGHARLELDHGVRVGAHVLELEPA